MDHSDQYFKKYLKYKEKYRLLKESIGGSENIDDRYNRLGIQDQSMPANRNKSPKKKMSSKELFKHDFDKWKVTYPRDYQKWMNKLKITNPIKYNQLLREEINPRAKKSREQRKQVSINGNEAQDRARQQALQEARKYETKEYQEQSRREFEARMQRPVESEAERQANIERQSQENFERYQRKKLEEEKAREERAREERNNQPPSGFYIPSRDFR